MLDDKQADRYSRQIVLPEVGGSGQERLLNASVLIVGAGGLGCPVATALCGAGVGKLTIYDFDTVELSNLHRQTLFREEDIGLPKADVVRNRLNGLNPDCEIRSVNETLDAGKLEEELEDHHLVVEGSDAFDTKFMVNDGCVKQGVPMVLGGILRHTGQVLSVLPGESACYRCIFESPPPETEVPDCSEAGVLGALAGTIGNLQAYEVKKIILGFGTPLFGTLLEIHPDKMDFRTVPFESNPDCPACTG